MTLVELYKAIVELEQQWRNGEIEYPVLHTELGVRKMAYMFFRCDGTDYVAIGEPSSSNSENTHIVPVLPLEEKLGIDEKKLEHYLRDHGYVSEGEARPQAFLPKYNRYFCRTVTEVLNDLNLP